MIHNIGSTDRVIRIILGAAAIILGLVFQSWWGLIGIPLLVTAFIRMCPVYLPFGISTIGQKHRTAGVSK